MITMDEPRWVLESVEESEDGVVTAAVLARGDVRVRLVHADRLVEQVANLDPMGKLVGSALAEIFAVHKLSPVSRALRQVGNAANLAAEHARLNAPDAAILVKKRRRRPSDTFPLRDKVRK